MKALVFQVTFLSDIVLPATSNTEGKIDQLDFIAGSNFLGMVAQKYKDFQNSFDVFHSGKVRFGDGHILKDDKLTYKMPLSIFKEKTDETKIVNQITTSLDTLKQAQQLRNGYITKDKEQVFVDYTYSQKSAYDAEKRTSKKGQMYGYKAIKKGSTWQFVVKVDGISTEDEKLLIDTLKQSTRLGKSKSAEYGQVAIEQKGSIENVSNESNLSKETTLYCNSRLALVDECGNPTYDLKYLCNGLDIQYEKTQIRTSTFTPYNGARQTKDYERVCINKGSVIVVKDLKPEQFEAIKKGVGAFKSEGFGEIIINPSFLMEKDFTFAPKPIDKQKKDERQKITKAFENNAVQFLANRHNYAINILEIANEVAMFIKDNEKLYDKKMNSQWGTIRSLCANNNDKTIEEAVSDYISKGVAKDKWEGNKKAKLLEAIAKNSRKLQFTKLLSIQMPKVKESKKDHKEQNNDSK